MKATLGRGVLAICMALALFLAGFFLDSINLKTVMYVVFGIAGLALWILPIRAVIVILFCYLGIEGFAKMLTRYNPIIHVGADILIILMIIRVALSTLANRKGLPKEFPPLIPLFALHGIWFLMAIANPNSLGIIASLAGGKVYLTTLILYFFGFYAVRNLKEIRTYMLIWVILCGVQCLSGLVQSSIGPKSVTKLSPAYIDALKQFEGYAFRPFGLTSVAGGPSVYVYLMAPYIFYFLLHSKSTLSKISMIALLPAAATTLFVCQVRSALLKALIGAVCFILLTFKSFKDLPRRMKLNIMIASSIIPILVAIALPKLLTFMIESRDENKRAIERTLSLFDTQAVSKARYGAMERFFRYMEMAPLGAGLMRTGAGARLFKDADKQDDPFQKVIFFADNLWVTTMIDLGIPGTIIITLILIFLFIEGIKGMQTLKNPEFKAINNAILCSLFASILGCYGAEPILYNPESTVFWFFAGVLVRLPSLECNHVPA